MSDVQVRSGEVSRTTERVLFDDEFPSPRPKDWLDLTIDVLEPLMPDMAMLGALMLLLVAYLAASGSDFGSSQETLASQREAEAAASTYPGYVPF